MLNFFSSPKFRRWALGAVLVLLPLLIWLSWQRLAAFDWAALGHVYNQIDWRWMLPGGATVLASYLARALRWQVMLRPLNPHSSLRRILENTLIGFTAIVLFGRPGELVRPYLISRSENVPLSSQLAAWFLERIYDLLAVLLQLVLHRLQLQRHLPGDGPVADLDMGGDLGRQFPFA